MGDDDEEDEPATIYMDDVERKHPLTQRVFRRSTLTSEEIRVHRQAKGRYDFGLASFTLLYQRDHSVHLTSTSSEPITIKHEDGTEKELTQGGEETLQAGDVIIVDREERAIFSNS